MLDHGVNAALAGALETVCLVEGEAFCVANLVAQMEQGFISPVHIWSDVKTVTSAAARRVISERLGGRRLDFIVAGFPCQPWSNAGKRLGKLDDRDLWPNVLKAIDVYQPRYVFLENVDGIAGKIDGARRILCDLEKAGYIAKAGLFSSKEIGGTHLRRRWFFLGIDKSEQQCGQRECADGCSGEVGRSGGGLSDDPLIIERKPHDEKLAITRQDTRRDIVSSGGRLAFPISESIPRRRGSGDVASASGRVESEEDERQRCGLAASDSDLDVRTRVPARNDFGAWGIVAEIDPALLPTLSTLAIRRIAERNVQRAVAGNLEGRPAGEDLQTEIECEFRRLAHEYSARDHKLRAIGNSVDWKVAMYAFVTLYACMENELCGEEIHELGQIDLFDVKPPEPLMVWRF